MHPPKGKTTLVFSFVGMQTQEVVVDEKDKLLEITLEAASEDLQEVVVTGYSSLPKERATGSINVISKKQLDKPATNFASRLIGTTAGLASTLDSRETQLLKYEDRLPYTQTHNPCLSLTVSPWKVASTASIPMMLKALRY